MLLYICQKILKSLSAIVSHHLVCRRGWHLIIASLLIKFFTLSAMVTVISNLIYYQRKHFCYCYCYCYCYCKSKHPCLNMINNFNFSPHRQWQPQHQYTAKTQLYNIFISLYIKHPIVNLMISLSFPPHQEGLPPSVGRWRLEGC